MASREYDIIVWGGSSFTGAYVVEYLALNSPPGTKVAIGGRNRAKIEQVRSRLAAKYPAAAISIESMDTLIGDSHDSKRMHEVAAQTRVIASTVGPYALHGEPLIRACVAEKTDYCDITGEVAWVYQLHKELGEQAARNGIHIVPMCGFDCIPADLGCLMLAQYAREKLDKPLVSAKGSIVGVRAGVSGGTLATLANQLSIEARKFRKSMSLSRLFSRRKPSSKPKGKGAQYPTVHYDKSLKRWQTYWIMKVFDHMAVNWANKQLNYGPDFDYSVSMSAHGWLHAVAHTAGLFIGTVFMFFSITRNLLYASRIIPRPGEGPSEEFMKTGYFSLHMEAKTDSDVFYGKVSASTDPGYSETIRYLGESALCLAYDRDSTFRAGIAPPSVAMGTALLKRLRAKGCQFDVGPEPIPAVHRNEATTKKTQ